MKELVIVLTLFTSIGSFAAEVCKITKIPTKIHEAQIKCTDNAIEGKAASLRVTRSLRHLNEVDLVKILIDEEYNVENPHYPELYIKR